MENRRLLIGMKTERIRTELSGATFVFIFFTEVKTNTETPETNMKTNIVENKYRPNTTQARNIKRIFTGTKITQIGRASCRERV